MDENALQDPATALREHLIVMLILGGADELEWRLEEAEAMQPELIPGDVVTMNSTVRLVKVNSAAELTGTVVYPEDVDPEDVDLVDDGVSVLDELGARLIGCEVGDVVECEKQKDRGPWRIAEIVFQPERVCALHL